MNEQNVIYERLVDYFNRMARIFGNDTDTNLCIEQLDRLCELLQEGEKL